MYLQRIADAFAVQQIFDVQFVTRQEGTTLADVSSSYPYRRAVVRIFPRFFDEPKATQEITIIHEVMHLCVSQMVRARRKNAAAFSEAEENTVDQLAIGIRKLMR